MAGDLQVGWLAGGSLDTALWAFMQTIQDNARFSFQQQAVRGRALAEVWEANLVSAKKRSQRGDRSWARRRRKRSVVSARAEADGRDPSFREDCQGGLGRGEGANQLRGRNDLVGSGCWRQPSPNGKRKTELRAQPSGQVVMCSGCRGGGGGSEHCRGLDSDVG